MAKTFVVVSVIIAFYVTRSIDCTCKAVAQLKLSHNSEIHFHYNFRVFKSAYSWFISLNHLRTSESVTLPVQKVCINLIREPYFCKSSIYFTHPTFPGSSTPGTLKKVACHTKIGLCICQRSSGGAGKQGGDKGIKKNNLKIKHHERSDELKS